MCVCVRVWLESELKLSTHWNVDLFRKSNRLSLTCLAKEMLYGRKETGKFRLMALPWEFSLLINLITNNRAYTLQEWSPWSEFRDRLDKNGKERFSWVSLSCFSAVSSNFYFEWLASLYTECSIYYNKTLKPLFYPPYAISRGTIIFRHKYPNTLVLKIKRHVHLTLKSSEKNLLLYKIQLLQLHSKDFLSSKLFYLNITRCIVVSNYLHFQFFHVNNRYNVNNSLFFLNCASDNIRRDRNFFVCFAFYRRRVGNCRNRMRRRMILYALSGNKNSRHCCRSFCRCN